MNRFLTFGLVAVSGVLLTRPVYAAWHGGGGGGGGGVHFSAPAVSSAPAAHFSTHAIAPQHFSTNSQFFTRSAPVTHGRSTMTFPASGTVTRSFVQSPRNAPTVAFGGPAVSNGGDPRSVRVPGETSRGWDRGQVYAWNHHHYRWYNGAWVVFDDGYYGYPYDYAYPYYNDYDQEPAPAVTYDSSLSTATAVQDQLARQGYNPGPVDGVVGPQTRDAITDFQYANHLPVTGQIDGPLLKALSLY